jgi:Flp pilus assembly protein TadB
MTQHINLLFKKPDLTAPMGRLLLAPLAAVLLVLLALWAMGQNDEAQARRNEQSEQQQLQQARVRLDASLKTSGGNLDKEIEALKPKAQAAQLVLGKLDTLGRQQGYSDYLNALAGVSEKGVWLNKVEITQGGKSVSLSGRAMDKSAVLAYVKKLNARFASLGVTFSTLDITPEAAQGNAGASGSALAVVAFKLN